MIFIENYRGSSKLIYLYVQPKKIFHSCTGFQYSSILVGLIVNLRTIRSLSGVFVVLYIIVNPAVIYIYDCGDLFSDIHRWDPWSSLRQG